MKTQMTQYTKELIFKFLLALDAIATAIVTTLTVFAFVYIATLEMLAVLIVGLGMVLLVALACLTVWHGNVTYRN